MKFKFMRNYYANLIVGFNQRHYCYTYVYNINYSRNLDKKVGRNKHITFSSS